MTKYESNLKRLIEVETISVVGQTDLTKFEDFHKLLAEVFPSLFEASVIEEINGCLLMKWPGKTNEHPILLMNHSDVVETPGNWTHAPFSGDIADGQLWGRGTLDTKGGLWAMMQAADDLAAEGFVPETDIWFESSCNEEITNEGAEYLSGLLKERGIAFDLVLDEGFPVMIKEDGGLEASIGIGEKGVTELEFIARSAGGHASRPPKEQPWVRLGRFMAAVEDHLDEIFPPKLNKETGTVQQTSIAFTVAQGSTGRNVLPARASIIVSMRSSHHQTVDGSIKAISEFAAGFGLETEVLYHGVTSSLADTASPAYKGLISIIRDQFKVDDVEPKIMTGATDACYMTRVSDCAVRFTPFVETEAQHDTIHTVDERVSLSALPGAVKFFKRVIKAAPFK